MPDVLRIKRRLTGAVGAPTALATSELAYNELDNTLYYGQGDSGVQTALTIIPIAGRGAFLPLTGGTVNGNVAVSGTFTVSGATTHVGNVINLSTFSVSGATTLSSTLLVSGATTHVGAATAPTVATADSSTNIATTAFVKNQGYATSAAVAAGYLPLTGGTLSGQLNGTSATFSGNVIGNNSVQSNGVYFQNNNSTFYTPQSIWTGNVIYIGNQSIYWQNQSNWMYTNANMYSAGAVGVGGSTSIYWNNNGGWMYCPVGVWCNNINTNGIQCNGATVNAGAFNVGGPQWSANGGWMYTGSALMGSDVVVSYSGNGCWLQSLGVSYRQYTSNQMTLWWTGGLVYAVVDNSNQGWITLNGSDRRLKRNFGPVTRDCLATLNAIVLESFDWPQTVPSRKRVNPQSNAEHARFEEQPLRTPHWEVGYTAQQVREVMPEAVPEPPEGGNLGVDLQMMVAHLIGAVQQLTKRLAAVEAR